MNYSAKPQRINTKARQRNGQMPSPTYNAAIHYLSAPNVSNAAQLQVNRKYINNMGNINEAAASGLQYHRTANMPPIKNHNLEVNHFQNVRHQQPTPAYVYKTPQFYNQLNPHLQQKFPVNHPMQRKLFKKQAAVDVLQQSHENIEFSSKKCKELQPSQQEVNTNNKVFMPTNVGRTLVAKASNNQEESNLLKNDADENLVKHEVPSGSASEPATLQDITENKTEVQQDMEQVLSINNEHTEPDFGGEEVNEKTTKDTREKTPMCLINDLARFNKILFQYRLTGESGPAHCKLFTVTLELGNEEYTAEGFKIKKAQHLAATEAIQKTKYKHPTPKTTRGDLFKSNITPTVELNALAMKLGQQTSYIFDAQQLGNNSGHRFNSPSYEKSKATTQQSSQSNTFPLINRGRQFQNINQKRQFLPKFQNRYPTFQHSIQQNNFASAAGRTYLNSRFPCKITLLVGTKQFVGVGKTVQHAKHDAASNALQVLKEQMKHEQVETHDKSFEDNGNKSPISLVFEMGIKRNLPVDFKVLREDGPAHMRTYITACTVGEITTEGTGNGKKISKKKAAQEMLEKLKNLPPITPVVASPVKRVKLKIFKQKYVGGDPTTNDNLVEPKEGIQKSSHKKNSNTESETDNPINKLLEWHQNKKQKEPVFKLINECGNENSHRRQFVMEVSSNEIVARGVGNSKKMAKLDAAKKCLLAIAESEQNPVVVTENDSNAEAANTCEIIKEAANEANSHSDVREKTFKSLPLNKKSCQEQENVDKTITANCSSTLAHTASASKETPNATTNTSSNSRSHHMKEKLMYLSKLLGFDVEFSDYPKGNHNEFLTIVMLSTNPPQICHGVGVNAKDSQEDAAKNALQILSEMGLNNALNA